MSITLIANSGIQFYSFDLDINNTEDLMRPVGFYESPDISKNKITLEYAYYLADFDIWVPKSALAKEKNLDEKNVQVKDDVNFNIIKNFSLKENQNYFTISDPGDSLDLLATKGNENIWLPAPYFKTSEPGKTLFGPIAWTRLLIKEKLSANKKIKSYKITLAFDTKVNDEEPVYFAPRPADLNDEENTFNLTSNEDHLLNFCDGEHHCGWVEQYLKRIIQKGEDRSEFPYLRYLGYYIYLMKYFHATKIFPEVQLFSDNKKPIDVDLVLDIGNSNTCGLLFENANNGSFHFNAVKKLKLIDLSNPTDAYDEPFSMRLAFAEPKFGDISIPGYKNFRWPSILRLGTEAGRLINSNDVDINKGKETASHHSSPKRYLWDTAKAEIPWEFINYKGKNFSESIYYEGISEQFKDNGDYAYDGNFACLPTYSRKSLMTFVYIEIFLHAISQINSHEFRLDHGNSERPRKLKRITITCPTSIIQKEQVVLRECAVEAIRTLSRFLNNRFIGTYDVDDEKTELDILPRPKDLGKKLSELSFKKDWIYDEATCSQLVFLYAEISKRYLNKADVFFNLYGKKRGDVTNPDEKSLTIGSLDIGGGTTDLMISAYQYEKGQSLAVIKPHPLFWESFNVAGDDLLKEIVQQIIIEGKSADTEIQGAIGVIENAARNAGVTDLAEKLQNFFGPDSNKQSFIHRIFRKIFITQVAIPIGLHYLNHTIEEKPDKNANYDELFPTTKPNVQIIKYFNEHFKPLKFEQIVWKLSSKRVNAVIETTLEPLLKQLSAIMSAYGCDFVLLAGRPTTIPKIREMFIKYYPVSPDRIISLNKYRVGRWYPFADDLGYFSDPKTIVSVGALIALMGGNIDKLDGFRLNTELLRKRLIATSDYIGLLDPYTQNIEEIYLSPDQNSHEIEVHTLPMTFGYKQLPNRSYRARPIYKMQFNDAYFKEKVLEQNPLLHTEKELSTAIETYRTNLKSRMPFKVKIKRDWSSSKEVLYVDTVRDSNKNESSKQILNLSFMTLQDEKGYWLDTGEFILNIK